MVHLWLSPLIASRQSEGYRVSGWEALRNSMLHNDTFEAVAVNSLVKVTLRVASSLGLKVICFVTLYSHKEYWFLFQIKESRSYEIIDFFSDIGGCMGLYLGWSVLTLIELIQFVHDIIRVSLKKYGENKVTKVVALR